VHRVGADTPGLFLYRELGDTALCGKERKATGELACAKHVGTELGNHLCIRLRRGCQSAYRNQVAVPYGMRPFAPAHPLILSFRPKASMVPAVSSIGGCGSSTVTMTSRGCVVMRTTCRGRPVSLDMDRRAGPRLDVARNFLYTSLDNGVWQGLADNAFFPHLLL